MKKEEILAKLAAGQIAVEEASKLLVEVEQPKTYEDVPWYRREPGALTFLAALILAPVLITLCIICLTGDVYKNSYDRHGNLQVWGVGNKIAAVLILIIQLGLYVLFLTTR